MGFISTKPDEHLANYRKLAYKTSPLNEDERKMLAFYEEYFAIMDLPHEFYESTVNRVFRGNEWARGKVMYNGNEVRFSDMTTPLITVE